MNTFIKYIANWVNNWFETKKELIVNGQYIITNNYTILIVFLLICLILLWNIK